jgi:glycosyltransferase involved in cell wall biosynthesis
LGIQHAEVIPNGIDLGEFRPAPPSSLPVILFTGLLSYYPNQQGIRWFLDQVFPWVLEQVPHARVVVAGAAPPRWLLWRQSASIEVTGLVTDMRPYIRDAAAVIAPLMIGGGTRVKILEAQAMARPVVSTSVGAEGLHQHPGETLLIADDAETFARQLVRILTTPDEARAIALRGRTHVAQFFDWDRIGERLNRLLDERLGLLGRSDDHGARGLPAPPDIPALRAS